MQSALKQESLANAKVSAVSVWWLLAPVSTRSSFFSERVADIWNGLSSRHTDLSSLARFKRCINSIDFSDYSEFVWLANVTLDFNFCSFNEQKLKSKVLRCIVVVWFCNFSSAVSAFALLSCSTVHVDALFPFNSVIEQMNEWMKIAIFAHCLLIVLLRFTVSHFDFIWQTSLTGVYTSSTVIGLEYDVDLAGRIRSARTGKSAAMSSRSTPLMHAAKYRSLSTNYRTRTCRSGLVSWAMAVDDVTMLCRLWQLTTNMTHFHSPILN